MKQRCFPPFEINARPLLVRCGCVALMSVAMLGWPAAFAQPPAAGQPPVDGQPMPAAGQPAGDKKPVEKLPYLNEMQLPTYEEILKDDPLDWVILEDDRVIRVDPLNPRPGTLEFLRDQLAEATRERRKYQGDELVKYDEQLKEMSYLYVILPDGPVEYRLPMNMVRELCYYEDLILARIDDLLKLGDLDKAKELLNRMQIDSPEWQPRSTEPYKHGGFVATMHRMLFRDAEIQMQGGRPETALVVLEELHRRNPTYEGLSAAFGTATQTLIDQALQRDDLHQVRHVLKQLAAVYPSHPVYTEQASRLNARASELITWAEGAVTAHQYSDAAGSAEEALRNWPEQPNLIPRAQKIFDRWQRLHVGVVSLPADGRYSPFIADAERRRLRLGDQPLFHIERILNGSAQYRTRYFNEWDPFDLGRRMRFTLRPVRQPWERQGPLDAEQAARLLLERLDPEHPLYDERLAGYVKSVAVEGPYSMTLTFHRVPARIEALLSRIAPDLEEQNGQSNPTVPLVTTSARSADASTTVEDAATAESVRRVREPEPDQAPVNEALTAVHIDDGTGGFVFTKIDDRGQALHSRSRAEPDGLPLYHVSEVVEHKYDSYDRVVQALERGDIAAAVDLPSWFVLHFLEDKELSKQFNVHQNALPVVHVLQFNPQSQTMSNRLLRRALSYSVNRERLLKDVVLRDPQLRHGRLVETPFASSSYASAGISRVQYFDLAAAATLVLAGSKEIGDTLPPIRFVVPPEPLEQRVCEQLTRLWKRIGLPMETVSSGDTPVEDWDVAYRKVQFTEPVIDLWPFLTAQDRARLSDLDGRPDWLRHDLVELDRITDWNRAVVATRDLLQRLNADVAYLPLWEVDQFLVFKKTIRNVPQTPIHCYDNVDLWVIEGAKK